MAGEFVKVKCKECKNEQVIFSKPSGDVKCLVCGALLSARTGGKGNVGTKVIEEMR